MEERRRTATQDKKSGLLDRKRSGWVRGVFPWNPANLRSLSATASTASRSCFTGANDGRFGWLSITGVDSLRKD